MELSDFEVDLEEISQQQGITPGQRQNPSSTNSEASKPRRDLPTTQPCTSNGDPLGSTPQPTRRFTGEQAEEFRTLRKLVYKKFLAKYYRDEILKGIAENKFLIKVEKPALNLVEGGRAPQEFNQRIDEILLDATEKINTEVSNFYDEVIPQLTQEWDLHIEICKTKFGTELTKTVVTRAKTVALEFLKTKFSTNTEKKEEEKEPLSRPKNGYAQRGQKRWRTPNRTPHRRDQNRRESVEKLLNILKTFQ